MTLISARSRACLFAATALLGAALVSACGGGGHSGPRPASASSSGFPAHDQDRGRAGQDLPPAAADRVAVAERHRGPVRARRRQPGRRGRLRLDATQERAPHHSLGLPPQRRGDREVPTRPGRDLRRHQPHRRAARQARGAGADSSPAPSNLSRGVRASSPSSGRRPATRPARGGRSPICASRSQRSCARCPARHITLTVYHELDQTDYSADSRTFVGADLQDVRAQEHRRQGGQDEQLSPALARVHRRLRPRPDRARGHRLLRPDGRQGRRAAGLEEHRGGQGRGGRAGQRLARVRMGPAVRRSS